MSYTALYRKFRPDIFEDVKGQDHIVTTLRNQIRADRIGHAFPHIFCCWYAADRSGFPRDLPILLYSWGDKSVYGHRALHEMH